MNTKGSRNDGLNNLALTILITVFGIKLLARVFCFVVFCFVSFFYCFSEQFGYPNPHRNRFALIEVDLCRGQKVYQPTRWMEYLL